MTDRAMGDFMLSATLHAVVVGVLLGFGYFANQQVRNMPQILELVAGEGDNFAATVAPALGTPAGISLDIPVPVIPVSEPETPPVEVAAAPIEAAPPPPANVAEAPPATDFAKEIRWKLIRAESQAKLDAARARRAAAKKAQDEAKKAQTEAKRRDAQTKQMTKAEFDRMNNKKAPPAKGSGATTKVARIDAEGIAKGVVGGSTANKTGGAGGKALVANHDNLLAAYFGLFKQRLIATFTAPDGLSDTLEVVIRVQSNANGSLTNPRVIKSSGSSEFDRAVLEAVRRVSMPPRPDGKSEPIDVPFSMRERDL